MIYLCLSSCHSAMCFPGWARTSFQCRNSSPLHCEERVKLPSSLLLTDLCSFITVTVITSFWTLLGSTVQVSASLKIGEQLSDFRLVRSLPTTLSPMVTCNLACGSVNQRGKVLQVKLITCSNWCPEGLPNHFLIYPSPYM